MSASSIEREVQDYLDGRLTPHERSAFEERMRSDVRLSRRVQAAKEIGTLLREDPGELSPEFYARARRRFEESAAPRQRGFRLRSWEAAGLATAAVLLLALFLPRFVREGAPKPSRPPTTATAPSHDLTDDAPAAEPVHPPAPRPAPPPALKERPQPPDPAAAEERYAPVPPPAPPAAGGERENELRPRADAPAPLAMPMRELEQSSAESLRTAPRLRTALAPTIVALPPGGIAPGVVRIVEEPQAWEALLHGEAGPALAALGPADAERRLVLIGEQRDLDDCSALVLVETAEAWELRYRSAEKDALARAASGGCAVVLPRDGKVVRVSGSE